MTSSFSAPTYAPRARLRAFWGDPGAQLLGASLLTLAAVVIRAARFPDIGMVVTLLPAIALVMAALAALVLVLGGVGWLGARLVQVLVRWRAHEELHEGMSKTQMAWVVVGVVFLGLPEFAHAMAWWQDAVLQDVPGEKALVDAIVERCREHSKEILSVTFVCALWCAVLWNVFKDIRTWVRKIAKLARDLLTGRKWIAPILLALTLAATFPAAVHWNSDRLFFLSSVELIALTIWFLAPVILPNLIWILIMAAWAMPPLMVAGFKGRDHMFLGLLVIWGVWLFSILVNRPIWRIPYWLGVFGFLVYLVHS